MIRMKMTKQCEFPDERIYRAFLRALADSGVPNMVISALRLYDSPQKVEEGAWVTTFEVEKKVDLLGDAEGAIEVEASEAGEVRES